MSKTEMKLFDKQFVNVIWDDTLLRKPCFYADEMGDLINYVENNNLGYKDIVTKSNDIDYPFAPPGCDMGYRFAYYDPNYELKRAYNDDKTIQCQDVSGDWHDCVPNWNTKDKYRVKPDTKIKRRMTNRELAKWLADGNGQLKLRSGDKTNFYSYCGHDEVFVPKGLTIRGWNETEWHEPEVK